MIHAAQPTVKYLSTLPFLSFPFLGGRPKMDGPDDGPTKQITALDAEANHGPSLSTPVSRVHLFIKLSCDSWFLFCTLALTIFHFLEWFITLS